MSAKAGSPTRLELEAVAGHVALAGQLEALGNEHLEHLKHGQGQTMQQPLNAQVPAAQCCCRQAGRGSRQAQGWSVQQQRMRT